MAPTSKLFSISSRFIFFVFLVLVLPLHPLEPIIDDAPAELEGVVLKASRIHFVGEFNPLLL